MDKTVTFWEAFYLCVCIIVAVGVLFAAVDIEDDKKHIEIMAAIEACHAEAEAAE